jgi:hypothetical protein
VNRVLQTRRAVETPAVLAVLSTGTALLVASGTGSAVRALAVVLFVLVVPGATLLAPFGLLRDGLGLVLCVAVGTAVTTFVATALLYAQAWEPVTALVVLATLTALVNAAEVLRRLRAAAVKR